MGHLLGQKKGYPVKPGSRLGSAAQMRPSGIWHTGCRTLGASKVRASTVPALDPVIWLDKQKISPAVHVTNGARLLGVGPHLLKNPAASSTCRHIASA